MPIQTARSTEPPTSFWEYFLNSGLQKPNDPGDPSMPYGPPLWPMPEQRRSEDMGSYDRFDLSWATGSADPSEVAAGRVAGAPGAVPRAPVRWLAAPDIPLWAQQPPTARITVGKQAQQQSGDGGVQPQGPTPSRAPAELRNWDLSPSEKIKYHLSDFLSTLGVDRYRANILGDKATTALSLFPPTGIPLAAAEAQHAGDQGDLLGAGIAAFGVLPGAKPAARAAAEVASEAIPAIRRAALGAAGGKYPLQPGWFASPASIPVPRGLVRSDLALTPHRPIEEMSATVVPTGSLQPRKTFDPAALQGGVLMPAVGDRTAAGAVLTHVNEVPLSRPVLLEGGYDIARSAANAHDRTVWAAHNGPASRMARHARELGANGRDVYLVDSMMSAQSGDSSKTMADALLSQLDTSEITRRAAADFNARMASKNSAWPGFKSSTLRDLVLGESALREQFVKEMALARHQVSGFPDIASTRKAIMEPALVGQPTGASGYAVSKFDPAPRIITEPTIPHSRYSTQVGPGQYIGSLEVPIPRELAFRDFFANRRAAGKPALGDDRAFSLGNVSQEVDQQLVDLLSQYIEQQKLRR
jgi:hypothetical protein